MIVGQSNMSAISPLNTQEINCVRTSLKLGSHGQSNLHSSKLSPDLTVSALLFLTFFFFFFFFHSPSNTYLFPHLNALQTPCQSSWVPLAAGVPTNRAPIGRLPVAPSVSTSTLTVLNFLCLHFVSRSVSVQCEGEECYRHV